MRHSCPVLHTFAPPTHVWLIEQVTKNTCVGEGVGREREKEKEREREAAEKAKIIKTVTQPEGLHYATVLMCVTSADNEIVNWWCWLTWTQMSGCGEQRIIFTLSIGLQCCCCFLYTVGFVLYVKRTRTPLKIHVFYVNSLKENCSPEIVFNKEVFF